MTTPEFLQFALIEALGGDAPDTEYYDDDDMDDYLVEDNYSDDQELNNADSSSCDDSEVSAMASIPHPAFHRMSKSILIPTPRDISKVLMTLPRIQQARSFPSFTSHKQTSV